MGDDDVFGEGFEFWLFGEGLELAGHFDCAFVVSDHVLRELFVEFSAREVFEWAHHWHVVSAWLEFAVEPLLMPGLHLAYFSGLSTNDVFGEGF